MVMMGMPAMEHPDTTVSALPLVDSRVVLYFCNAVQAYAATTGAAGDVAPRVRTLRARLDNLRDLASLCRLAIVGDPYSFARVVDELACLAVDFPADPLETLADISEAHEDEPDDRVLLGAAVDLFAGATFVSKGKPEQRDRFIVAIVRAIEAAIAFPVTFWLEAATYVGDGDGSVQPLHARLVIANATQRLIDGDAACRPHLPKAIRRRLYCIARAWMRENPVDAFFAAVSGPRVRDIVHWEDPARERPDDARVGDPVTILVERPAGDEDCCSGDPLGGYRVMFSPHAPATVIRTVRDGLEVRVPEGSRTGPIAVLVSAPDFAPVKALIARFTACFPTEWSQSVFASVRMDVWAFPTAFGPPVLEILRDGKEAPSNVPPATGNPNMPGMNVKGGPR
jgi:hypothetical protein